jgi:hypothetical protein
MVYSHQGLYIIFLLAKSRIPMAKVLTGLSQHGAIILYSVELSGLVLHHSKFTKQK